VAKVDDRTSLGWQLYVLINGGVAWVTFRNPALRMRFLAQSIDYSTVVGAHIRGTLRHRF
jgi:hypothetical protein